MSSEAPSARGEAASPQGWWPLLLAAGFLALGLAFVAGRAGGTPPRFAYPVDDTYIFMAMAKNLALHSTWGVNPNEFAPAASSPLWNLVIAGMMKVIGAQAWIPFALSSLCAMALLFQVDSIGRREGWPGY